MRAQRGWRKGFKAKCAQERERFSTSHHSPSAFVCRVPVHGQGGTGEHRAEQWGWHEEFSNRVVLLTALFQRVLNPSRGIKSLSSFQIFNTAASLFFCCFVLFFLTLSPTGKKYRQGAESKVPGRCSASTVSS